MSWLGVGIGSENTFELRLGGLDSWISFWDFWTSRLSSAMTRRWRGTRYEGLITIHSHSPPVWYVPYLIVGDTHVINKAHARRRTCER